MSLLSQFLYLAASNQPTLDSREPTYLDEGIKLETTSVSSECTAIEGIANHQNSLYHQT